MFRTGFHPRLACPFAAALMSHASRGAALGGRDKRRQCRLSRLLGCAGAAAGRNNLSAMMIWLREHLPDDAIIANGAGGFAA